MVLLNNGLTSSYSYPVRPLCILFFLIRIYPMFGWRSYGAQNETYIED